MERWEGIPEEEEGENLDGIQEVGVGEDRQPTRQNRIARFSGTDVKREDTCPMYVLTVPLLETALAKTV